MPTLAEMLDPEAIERLNRVTVTEAPEEVPAHRTPTAWVAPLPASPPWREREMRVETALLSGITARPTLVTCGNGCGQTVTIIDGNHAGLPVCQPCMVAMTTGSSIPEPTRTTPMAVTVAGLRKKSAKAGKKHTKKSTKEITMPININDIPSAQLGEALKNAERARIAEGMPERCDKAERKRLKREAKQKAAKAAERAALTEMGVLPGFTLHKVEVPPLDVASLANLDECPSAKARSPYNKCRNRMGEDLLPSNTDAGSPAATWRDLLNDHQRMAPLADTIEVAVEAKPKKAKAKKAKTKKGKAQVAAPIDLDEKVKIKALRVALGCTKAEARKILATV